DVAGLELEERRDVGNLAWDIPDHLVEIARLAALAVDVEPDGARRRVPDFTRWNERRSGGGVLEGLANLPGAAKLLRFALEVAPGHVEADAVAPDVRERVLGLDVTAAGLQCDDHLDLEVDVRGTGRIRKLSVRTQVVRILLEEEG